MDMQERLGPEWWELLGPLFDEPWMQKLGRRIGAVGHLRPDINQIFDAYRLCQPSAIRVIILAQDPYPHKHANGLAFSSTLNEPPLTLRIVFREMERTGLGLRHNPDLTDWANQGVFLLNTVLTCEEGQSLAHAGWGWEGFTGMTLRAISEFCHQPYVVMAWGRHAKDHIKKWLLWDRENVEVLEACHPVAESYSNGHIRFTGCNHFVKANQWLWAQGATPVNWTGLPTGDNIFNMYKESV